MPRSRRKKESPKSKLRRMAEEQVSASGKSFIKDGYYNQGTYKKAVLAKRKKLRTEAKRIRSGFLKPRPAKK